MGLEVLVIGLGPGAEGVRQAEHGVVDVAAEGVQPLQAFLVCAGLHVDGTRAHAALLVDGADVGGQAYRRFAHAGLAGEGVLADDAGAALGVQGDQFQAGLDVAGDVLHRGEAAPGDDLLQVLRLVQALLQFLVAALPVGHRQVPGQRVVRRHVDHGAGDGQGGERVVGRRLDDGIAAQHHVAQDGQQRQPGGVARDDMQGARAEAAHFKFGAVEQALLDPAFQVLDAHRVFHLFGDRFTGEQLAQAHVAALDHAGGDRRRQVGQLARFLQVRVAVEFQAFAEGLGVVEDVLEAERIQVGEPGRVTQRQLVDVLVRIGGLEDQVAATAAHVDQVVGDDLAADDHWRNRFAHGVSPLRC
ncbi:hypothetical protein D3C85_659320 [compost metagenome]